MECINGLMTFTMKQDARLVKDRSHISFADDATSRREDGAHNDPASEQRESLHDRLHSIASLFARSKLIELHTTHHHRFTLDELNRGA